MKTKLLRKIRKRFSWREVEVESMDEATFEAVPVTKYEMIDREHQSVYTFKSLARVFRFVVTETLKDSFIVDQRERRINGRKERNSYFKKLKEHDQLHKKIS